ncbi:hypothetical protein LR48_Vigan27s000900 [Vigna angularis]|nr:probable folate-biopterin transporter 8, chloroplastic isoform X2 [Vigna angularis]XP_052726797.1 probable folate-biopterin transporter 8, chloroplastic isoform X2 [Vigna angularis]KOM24939.1 hypothetical protein LR48_Vigan27s000900 [Vigna angularis]
MTSLRIPRTKPPLPPVEFFLNHSNPTSYAGNERPALTVMTRRNAVNERPMLTVMTRRVVVKERYEEKQSEDVRNRYMVLLCGLGYWVQGFRCFPWLALNFHMATNLNLHPSTLQLVQNTANLPMVAKPLYGILSDAIYINGARRIPYLAMGGLLQVLSWSLLALVPVAQEVLPYLIASVLISNLGASIAEVAQDALVAEYGKKHKIGGLQAYAFMALAAGGILGNLIGGYFLQKMPPRTMFAIFSSLLSLHLVISLSTREESLGISKLSGQKLSRQSISENIKKQVSDLLVAISDKSIFQPLVWIIGSIAMVPMLSGSMFCYQTQCLNLDPTVIGLSRVIGQLLLLSGTVLYNRFWKKISMRKLIGIVQILYASSLLLDLILVKQINLKWGIPNDVFALCFSGLAEIVAHFKLLPFSVLFASLCPKGCEGSLTAFLASALCLSSIASAILGVGLASCLGVRSGDYSGLTMGILAQFLAALVPLRWIHSLPMSQPLEKRRKRSMSRRARRNRRVGKVVLGSANIYRRERE